MIFIDSKQTAGLADRGGEMWGRLRRESLANKAVEDMALLVCPFCLGAFVLINQG